MRASSASRLLRTAMLAPCSSSRCACVSLSSERLWMTDREGLEGVPTSLDLFALCVVVSASYPRRNTRRTTPVVLVLLPLLGPLTIQPFLATHPRPRLFSPMPVSPRVRPQDLRACPCICPSLHSILRSSSLATEDTTPDGEVRRG